MPSPDVIVFCAAASEAARRAVQAQGGLIRLVKTPFTFAICFDKTDFSIGRGRGNDLTLESAADDSGWVALKHFRFSRAADGLTLTNYAAYDIVATCQRIGTVVEVKPKQGQILRAGIYLVEIGSEWQFYVHIQSLPGVTSGLVPSPWLSPPLLPQRTRSDPQLSKSVTDPSDRLRRHSRRIELAPAEGVIHSSSSSEVNLIYDHGVAAVAKVCRKYSHKEAWHEEAKHISSLHHANIITLLDFTASDKLYNELPVLRTPWKGPSLAEHRDAQNVCTLSFEDRHTLKLQMLDALSYLQDHDLVHRDIKPQNILYSSTDKVATLIDFGYALVSSHCRAGEISGTSLYLPPEAALFQAQTFQGDLWALGVTLLYANRLMPLPRKGWRFQEDPDWKRHNEWIRQIMNVKKQLARKDDIHVMLQLKPQRRKFAADYTQNRLARYESLQNAQ